MSETQAANQRSGSTAPLWVIAIVLVLALVGGGIYLLHKHQVSAKRDKYRDGAGYYCALSGYDPASPSFKNCVEDRIDVEIASGEKP